MTRRFAWLSLAVLAATIAIGGCAQGGSPTTESGDDAGVNADAGVAVDSGNDAMLADCPMVCTGTTPFCDKTTQKCVACLPSNDTCPATTYCQPDPNGSKCVPGCKTVSDCAGDGGHVACCGHACVDTTSNAANCGMCGHSCGASDGGVAACCSSACVDTNASAPNCGGCGMACMATHVSNATCAMATCGYDTCWPGYGDCDGNRANGCETPTSADPMRCGGCMNVCSPNHIASPTCTSNMCNGTCDQGYADCNANKLTDGCETHTDGDAQNCGGCAVRCSNSHITTPTCGAGVCNGVCDVGYADCNLDKRTDGCEVNVGADPANCGGCGNVCSTQNIMTPTCGAGVCNGVCNTGFGDCDNNKITNGCERPLSTVTDCGACGAPCAPANATGPTCASLSCSYASCNAGFQDCDGNRANGCESNKNSDTSNCGSCGNRCALGQTCQSGVCSSNDGIVYDVFGATAPVKYVPCGNGTNTNCTEPVAESSCTAIGKKLVSHASNGTSAVVSLGATVSCFWDISYFTNTNPSIAGQCLIGVSNAMWSGCCGVGSWHGNIVTIPTTLGQQFGYVSSNDSGYNAGMSNVTGTTWGCQVDGTPPPARPGCTTYYVACK